MYKQRLPYISPVDKFLVAHATLHSLLWGVLLLHNFNIIIITNYELF